MEQKQQQTPDDNAQAKRDIPHLVKWIILIVLILLVLVEFGAGEFDGFPKMGFWAWLILLIKLLLIAIIIILMRLQKDLRCEITDPSGCVTPVYDATEDKAVIIVQGTASGGAFQSYSLKLKQGALTLAAAVTYPGGGASGTIAVTAGELGRIDVTSIDPATTLHIEMTVSAASGATKVCTGNDFEIQRKIAYIDAIGEVPAQLVGTHPDDATEPFKIVNMAALPLPGPPPHTDPIAADVAIGGAVSVDGGADTYGCGRQMISYALQYQGIASGSNAAQVDAAAGWTPVLPALPFGDIDHPRWYWAYQFPTGPTQRPNFVLNGKITREWKTLKKLVSILPWTLDDRRVTVNRKWSTSSLNGRFTVRLVMTDDNIVLPPSAPLEAFDAATVWIDNREIEARITTLSVAGGAVLGMCDELSLSQFITDGSKVDMVIQGTAWDPLILGSYPNNLSPNDNFDFFNLHFKKDGAVSYTPIVTNKTPSVPPEKNESFAALASQTGDLEIWDIVGALDGGPKPAPDAPPLPAADPKIYRGDRCAYIIKLYVRDTTHLSDTGNPHDEEFEWPFCIVNDLPNPPDLAYPAP